MPCGGSSVTCAGVNGVSPDIVAQQVVLIQAGASFGHLHLPQSPGVNHFGLGVGVCGGRKGRSPPLVSTKHSVQGVQRPPQGLESKAPRRRLFLAHLLGAKPDPAGPCMEGGRPRPALVPIQAPSIYADTTSWIRIKTGFLQERKTPLLVNTIWAIHALWAAQQQQGGPTFASLTSVTAVPLLPSPRSLSRLGAGGAGGASWSQPSAEAEAPAVAAKEMDTLLLAGKGRPGMHLGKKQP